MLDWQGWGTALKPAWEPIIVARKPVNCTVAENVQKWGTGGINVDGCRVGFVGNGDGEWNSTPGKGTQGQPPKGQTNAYGYFGNSAIPKDNIRYQSQGRWPANLIHDGSDEVMAGFPVTTSPQPRMTRRSPDSETRGRSAFGQYAGQPKVEIDFGDSGSAARFFYCAKASKQDRDEGCEGMAMRELQALGDFEGTAEHPPQKHIQRRNHHPTVKPSALMRYLCKLVTPPGGIVLDPFMGSGSTGKAAILEGFAFTGIEKESEYCEIARARIEHAQAQGRLAL